MADTPIICGGVYSRPGSKPGTTHHGICLSIEVDGTKRTGELRFYGTVPERVEQGTLVANGLTLVGRPASPRVGRPRKE